MPEVVTPEMIRDTIEKLTKLYGQAADVAERLRELRERARAGEDIAAEKVASEDRLRELLTEIEDVRRPLDLAVTPPTEGQN